MSLLTPIEIWLDGPLPGKDAKAISTTSRPLKGGWVVHFGSWNGNRQDGVIAELQCRQLGLRLIGHTDLYHELRHAADADAMLRIGAQRLARYLNENPELSLFALLQAVADHAAEQARQEGREALRNELCQLLGIYD